LYKDLKVLYKIIIY